jgi:hypothetical protein
MVAAATFGLGFQVAFDGEGSASVAIAGSKNRCAS